MKEIILFALPFFGYENHILDALQSSGYKTHYISGRKGRLNDFLISFSKNRDEIYQFHIQRELEKLPLEQIDTMLVIKGVNLTPGHIEYIRSRNEAMRFVMYQWDSLRNFDFKPLIAFFDKVVTFDFNDAETLKIEYTPLFYTKDIDPDPVVEEDIDILLVGTYLPERYEAMVEMREVAVKNGLNFHHHIFIAPSYFLSNIKKFRPILKDLKLRQISRIDLIELYRRSKSILDVSNANQSGMSMRVVESYGMNKKLITSNGAIAKDSYACEMARIDKSASEKQISDFINSKVATYKNREKLSIKNWVINVLN